MKYWSWETGTPKERADMVRRHVTACHGNHETLAALFALNNEGVRQIIAGDIWRPEYRR